MMVRQLQMRCGCRLDPNQVCAQHPCQCVSCRRDRKGEAVEDDVCKWRTLHVQYLMDNFPSVHVPSEMEKVTYVEALELSGGKAPQSARERNLLNIMAYHCSDGMTSSLMVLDKSQSIFRTHVTGLSL